MKIFLWVFFWFVYFPLIRILTLLLFWHPKVEERERFEKRNKFEFLAHSFREENLEADICFEFSSEGEYQQVAPLIQDALLEGKRIELVFFSPSVEKAILRLAGANREQIRYLRYPFLRIFPFIDRRCFSHWTTAKTLVLVRYDLFPEFLLWSLRPHRNLQMLWVTFKKERIQGKRPSFWKLLFLKECSSIVYAGAKDLNQGKDLGFPGVAYDFRIEQIRRRVEIREEKLSTYLPLYSELLFQIKSCPQALIFGNAWPSDLFLLEKVPADVLVVIVPHQLSERVLKEFHSRLTLLGREVFEISGSVRNEWRASQTILVNMKGILCELYSDFPKAYVGGGFEGSIHSVLEPLVAGAAQVSCGPAHYRSTEYDIGEELGRISEISTPEGFRDWLMNREGGLRPQKMDSVFSEYESMKKKVISC